jgi:hypothetical protein
MEQARTSARHGKQGNLTASIRLDEERASLFNARTWVIRAQVADNGYGEHTRYELRFIQRTDGELLFGLPASPVVRVIVFL